MVDIILCIRSLLYYYYYKHSDTDTEQKEQNRRNKKPRVSPSWAERDGNHLPAELNSSGGSTPTSGRQCCCFTKHTSVRFRRHSWAEQNDWRTFGRSDDTEERRENIFRSVTGDGNRTQLKLNSVCVCVFQTLTVMSQSDLQHPIFLSVSSGLSAPRMFTAQVQSRLWIQWLFRNWISSTVVYLLNIWCVHMWYPSSLSPSAC